MDSMQPLGASMPDAAGAFLKPGFDDVFDRATDFRLACARVPPELADAAVAARGIIANAEACVADGEDGFVDAEITRLRRAAVTDREAAAVRADARQRAEEERLEIERRAAEADRLRVIADAADERERQERAAAERERRAEADRLRAIADAADESERQERAAAERELREEADRLRAIADAADEHERQERLRRDASFARRLREDQAASEERERQERERQERLRRDASFARRLREEQLPPAPAGLTPRVRQLSALTGKPEASCHFWLEAAGGDVDVAASMMRAG